MTATASPTRTTLSDTDGDGVYDAREARAGTDPSLPWSTPGDVDVDGKADWRDDDIDGDGISNTCERRAGSDPRDSTTKPADADGDGVPDQFDASDTDGDGFQDWSEHRAGTNPGDANSKPGDRNAFPGSRGGPQRFGPGEATRSPDQPRPRTSFGFEGSSLRTPAPIIVAGPAGPFGTGTDVVLTDEATMTPVTPPLEREPIEVTPEATDEGAAGTRVLVVTSPIFGTPDRTLVTILPNGDAYSLRIELAGPVSEVVPVEPSADTDVGIGAAWLWLSGVQGAY